MPEEHAPKVVVHLGAHKTASTYLQARLAKSADALRQLQVGYVDQKSFRQMIDRAGGLRRCQYRFAVLSQRALRKALNGMIRQQHDLGARRIVLSEENILGNLADFETSQKFYPAAGARLRVICEALRGCDLELALSIRDYTTFLPSVWSHLVLRNGYRRFDPGIAQSYLCRGRGWAELVQDIQRAAPGIPITLWTYEHLAEAENDILQTLAGAGSGLAIKPLRWRALPGLSAAAVERIEDLVRAGQTPSAERVRMIANSFNKLDGHGRYTPWAEGTAKRLSERYANDIERIERIAAVRRIRPDSVSRAA